MSRKASYFIDAFDFLLTFSSKVKIALVNYTFVLDIGGNY